MPVYKIKGGHKFDELYLDKDARKKARKQVRMIYDKHVYKEKRK